MLNWIRKTFPPRCYECRKVIAKGEMFCSDACEENYADVQAYSF